MTIEETIYDQLVRDFNEFLNQNFVPSSEHASATKEIITYSNLKIKSQQIRRKELLKVINQKFELNKTVIKRFIDFAASRKIYFNYHEKKEIKLFFDSRNRAAFSLFIKDKIKDKNEALQFLELFQPLEEKRTLYQLRTIIEKTDKGVDILTSLFSAYIFYSFDLEDVHTFFSEQQTNTLYQKDYFKYLHTNFGKNLKREKALSFLVIDETTLSTFKTTDELKESVCSYIRECYNTLSNHCYLAIYIDLGESFKAFKWQLYADIILYSEKFVEENLTKRYFHPNRIEKTTKDYIPNLDGKAAAFNLANGGFTYKDCFILTDSEIRDKRSQEVIDDYGLLVLFEKNERDETPIPCPACRSLNVRGNSYPVIGVKSWECNNLLCPDKSKFNRGKRYSLASLVKQKAIFYEANEIKNGTIRKWQLDVLTKPSKTDILEFLVNHYTLVNDTVEFVDFNPNVKESFQRNFIFSSLEKVQGQALENFYKSPFFKRFEIIDETDLSSKLENISNINGHVVYCGDSGKILKNIKANSVDHAVTSPPYYNAKEYSSWDNIYCYLYDMYNNARSVFHVLKPGGTYLFNIFDYFDNENNIVFSAMGKKRMILGAYIIRLFSKAGFELVKNIIWYKGHVQGNRSFNQGNTFPYYQAPLNCYEHIFQFVKPTEERIYIDFPDILCAKPVHKMVKGKNVLGHTAPFPSSIPEMMVKKMSSDECVLDPYSGSFTTARTAKEHRVKSISIELDKQYCSLGLSLLKKGGSKNLELFS